MKSPGEILKELGKGLRGLAELAGAELEADLPLIDLSAGVPIEIECGKSGEVTDMHGTTVTFDAENLAALGAQDIDPEESLVKIGHTPIATDTPHYGSVTALRYDEGRDRLLASIVPTPALVRKNREEGFRRVSMELKTQGARGPFTFLHLAFLAARRPAFGRSLAPVDLAEATLCAFAEPEAEGFSEVMFREFDAKTRKKAASSGAALPDGSFPIQNEGDLKNAIQAIGRASDPEAARAHIKKRAAALGLASLIPASWTGAEPLDTDENVDLAKRDSQERAQMEANEKIKADPAAAEEREKTHKAEVDRLRARLTGDVKDKVAVFMAANVKRIPLKLRMAGLEPALIAAMELEASADPAILKFSIPDGKEKTKEVEVAAGVALARWIIENLPEQVSKTEATDLAEAERVDEETAPADDGLNKTVKFAKSPIHEKALVRLAEMRKTNPKANYTEAVEAVAAEAK